jgi:Zn-dependent peptidase ImmA (M78 family)
MMTNELPVEIVGRYMKSVPVKVEELARALGLRVTYAPLSDDVSGKIEHGAGDQFTITVNQHHAETRRRFTIAHEVAHFILHRDLIGDGVVDDALYRSKTLSDAIERQANRYAADILMPWWQVTAAFGAGCTTAEQMAQRFRVSVAVAEIRMKELAPALRRAERVPA